MTLSLGIFYAFAALIVGGALVVVLARDVFRSAIALAGVLVLVAGLFGLLNADFLAAAQLLVYVGGVLVLMLFVIMLLLSPQNQLRHQTNKQAISAALMSGVTATFLIVQFYAFLRSDAPAMEGQPSTAALGRLLMGEFLVPFEVVSLVLLAALVGAVYLSREERP